MQEKYRKVEKRWHWKWESVKLKMWHCCWFSCVTRRTKWYNKNTFAAFHKIFISDKLVDMVMKTNIYAIETLEKSVKHVWSWK